jgi:2-polyprenyl-3-methyl-5-hydroxy-6-metoxy-1,4-benzoquinol methylase
MTAHQMKHAPTLICRNCSAPLFDCVADLGMQPLSNAIRKPEQLYSAETFYPLRVFVCRDCLLVQSCSLESASDIFNALYPYFSSVSNSWIEHSHRYAVEVMQRFNLNSGDRVVEIACNDGYLLRWFKDAGLSVFGVEPTASTAKLAQDRGIPVELRFFGKEYASELLERGYTTDLMPANNVVAHVPDINDFLSGFSILLKPEGVATFEFHHVLNLLEFGQFDTIYHEHYYYHSLLAFSKILENNGLSVFDVEELTTHGGSLRVYAQRSDTRAHTMTMRVGALLAREVAAGLQDIKTYCALNEKIKKAKWNILQWSIKVKQAGLKVVGYGAPAKASTLLNYIGIGSDFFEYVVDDTPAKQGCFIPGTLVPISASERLAQDPPDVIAILAWNWADDIRRLPHVRAAEARGAQVISLSPKLVGDLQSVNDRRPRAGFESLHLAGAAQ